MTALHRFVNRVKYTISYYTHFLHVNCLSKYSLLTPDEFAYFIMNWRLLNPDCTCIGIHPLVNTQTAATYRKVIILEYLLGQNPMICIYNTTPVLASATYLVPLHLQELVAGCSWAPQVFSSILLGNWPSCLMDLLSLKLVRVVGARINVRSSHS